jgi:hypothetical protein
MDPATLATSITALLVPFLTKAGASVADEAIKRLPEAVGGLWKAVAERFKAKPGAEVAANDLTADAADLDNQELFELQLKKLLKEDPGFAAEVSGLFDKAQASVSITQQGSGAVATGGSVAAGSGGIAIGGSVSGNIVVGNQNKVSRASQGGSDDAGKSTKSAK